jgi:tetratricopeptide (TPR) repeat protein
LYYAFTPAGYFLVAFGAWWLAERRAILGLAILLAFLVSGPAFVAYANPAVETPGWLTQLWIGILERFYMLPSVPFALAAGIGVAQLLLWLRELPLQARLGQQVVSTAAVAMLALPVGVAVTHWSIADQSDNYVSYNFNRDLLTPLEPGAIMLMKGDITNFGVPYLQYVEHYRPDVITVNIEQLTFPWYVEQLRRHRPELVVPFDVYTQGRRNSLRDLVDANLAVRPIYIIGNPPNEPNFRAAYDVLRSGLSDRLMPKGTAPDPYALLRENLDRFTEFNPPTKVYPTISWESGIAQEYVRLILDVGHLLYNARRLDEAETLYRLLIEVSPTTPLTYKNLGVVLLERDGPSLEVAELWETYLRMQPNDHQAPAMRQRVDAILEAESLKDAP